MTVKRWKFVDVFLTADNNLGAGGTDLPLSYTFPRNPMAMSSPYPDKAVTPATSARGRHLLFEGTTPPKQWTFNGPLLDKDHFEDLYHWVYERKWRIRIEDHFGRHIYCYLLSMEVEPKRRIGYYYSHDYTISALALSVGAPTVANSGPA